MVGLPREEIGEIRSRVLLEELIRDYNIQLVPAGSSRLRALCPFHHEKTPSFHVNLEKQFYHCFGCKESGDIFTFVEKMDRVTFPEALEILARRAGVVLRRDRSGGAGTGEKVSLLDALARAEEYYHKLLIDDPRGEPARAYLAGRGIREEMWRRFRLGYSLPEWDGLLRYLGGGHPGGGDGRGRPGGMPPALLERAGLARSRERGAGHYDYFRGRVMFPVTDAQKRVIGFGARTLGDAEPKYLNSPHTALFDKGQVLYGLAQARAGIGREGRVAIMEGYTDVIMAHQEGLDFAVASLGTAFTPENVRRLRGIFGPEAVPRVQMVFDGDAAGQKAAERSLDLLIAEGLEVRVYTVTHGKDPCDALRELGGAEFRKRLEAESVDFFEFKWRRTVAEAEARGEGPAGVARAVDEVLALLARMPNTVARRLQTSQLVERLGLAEADVEDRVFPPRSPRGDGGAFSRRDGAFPPRSPGAFPPRSPRGDGGAFRGSGRSPRGEGGAAQGEGSQGAPAGGGSRPPGLEDVVLECLLAEPEMARERLEALFSPVLSPLGPPEGTVASSGAPVVPPEGTGASVLSPLGPPEGTGASVLSPLGPPEGTGASSGAPVVRPEGTGASVLSPLGPPQGTVASSAAQTGAPEGTVPSPLGASRQPPVASRQPPGERGAERTAESSGKGVDDEEESDGGEILRLGGRLRPILLAIERQLKAGELCVRTLQGDLADEEARRALLEILVRIERSSEAGAGYDDVWKNCLRELERKRLGRLELALERARTQARLRGDTVRYRALQQEHYDILRRLKSRPGWVTPRVREARVGGETEKGTVS